MTCLVLIDQSGGSECKSEGTCLNARSYQSVVADIHLFMTSGQRAMSPGFLNIIMGSLYCSFPLLHDHFI